MRRRLLLGELVLGQHVAGSLDDFVWQPRQLGDFDSVAAVCRAWLNASQKYDSGASLFDRHMKILHSRQLLGQLGELEIMCCEESLGPHAGVQVFDRSPRNR